MATSATAKARIKVADEVWLAVATLHQRNPERFDFSIEEVMESGRSLVGEGLGGALRPGFYIHVIQHCVANRPPQPGRYRMLVETGPGRRRLFRPGDYYHPEREGAKTTPIREHMPHNYNGLIAWYQNWCSDMFKQASNQDPLLGLRGSGRNLWGDEHPDAYVRRLREGWE